MNYRCLVVTDTFEANTLPHLLLTALDIKEDISDEDILLRENKYKDLAGLLVYKDAQNVTEDEIQRMHKLTELTSKSLLYIVDAEQYLSGKVFFKQDQEIHSKSVQVHSNNGVNFDVWLDSQASLWNPVDFLLDGAFASLDAFQPLDDSIMASLHESLEEINDKLDYLTDIVESEE